MTEQIRPGLGRSATALLGVAPTEPSAAAKIAAANGRVIP